MRAVFTKGSSLSPGMLPEIVSCAEELLAEKGISIPDEGFLETVKGLGFTVRDKRVIIGKKDFGAFLDELGARERRRRETVCPTGKLDGLVGIYSHKIESFSSPGEVRPMTAADLEHCARFTEKCAQKYGITGTVPGYADDVPSDLQSLHRYMTGAKYCRNVGETEPASALSAKYMFEMAEIMGENMDRLPIYPITPLCLAGDSLYTVLEGRGKLTSAYVYSMPFLGVTAPLSVPMCLALSLAETLGCALIMESVLAVPVDIRPSVAPFDMRAFSPSYGTSEKLLCELITEDFYAQLFDCEPCYMSTNVHTMAKTAGIQSVAEKGSMIASGAIMGSRYFYCLGTLDLDETFSPYQLILDIESLKRAERLVNGFPDGGEISAKYITDNLACGFLSTDMTLDNYADYVPYTEIFDHKAGSADDKAEAKLKDMVREIDAAEEEYILDEFRLKKLEEVYKRAEKDVFGQ